MALPKSTPSFVNLPPKPVFVPIGCYVSALQLAQELALELRSKCDEEIHRDQVEAIDEALMEVGRGRPALQAIADRARLVEIKHCAWVPSYLFPREWERLNVKVSRREFDEVQVGQSVKTRGILAEATMKTHEHPGRYFVRLTFQEAK